MKRIFALLVIAYLAGACSRQKFAVQANNDHVMSHNFNQTYQVIISQSESLLATQNQSAILEEIDNQMKARGFRKSEQSPDIIIVFSLYENKLKIKDSRKLDEDLPEYSTRRVTLKGGTLMIQMIDENLNKSIWLGMASGFLKPKTTLEERQIKALTRSILDEYKTVAYGYLPRN
ncbi:DUF4136 domain-containing protein [Flectobacillus major]|uniref:DUF4136 domain-containing protein n=1 Tax=Flectobacillus major TaxID=103 RepID=UPI00131EF8AF|nr:DUF4136 domain-containing protein [Flectobacillus major]